LTHSGRILVGARAEAGRVNGGTMMGTMKPTQQTFVAASSVVESVFDVQLFLV
jgi:hypothetical protein